MTKKVLGAVFVVILALSLGVAWAGSTAVLEIGNTISTGRTITVCMGATATESGTLLLNALNAITDASAAKLYLIKIEPGIYDVGSNNVQMKEYVDIAGSGELNTKITGNTATKGVVVGANYAEIRFLTVENTGGGTRSNAIYNYNASPKISNLAARASGATEWCSGITNYMSSSPTITNVIAVASSAGIGCMGVQNQTSCSPVMTNVTATASGGTTYNWGVLNHTSSSPAMSRVTATASGGNWSNGINNFVSSSPTLVSVTATGSGGVEGNIGMINHGTGCTVTADRCTFEATGSNSKSIYNDTGSTLFIGASKLSGPRQGSGTYHCANCYDGSYSTLNSDCQ